MDHQQREQLLHLIDTAVHEKYRAGVLAGDPNTVLEDCLGADLDATTAHTALLRHVFALPFDPPVAMIPLIAPPWRVESELPPQRRESGSDPDA